MKLTGKLKIYNSGVCKKPTIEYNLIVKRHGYLIYLCLFSYLKTEGYWKNNSYGIK